MANVINVNAKNVKGAKEHQSHSEHNAYSTARALPDIKNRLVHPTLVITIQGGSARYCPQPGVIHE